MTHKQEHSLPQADPKPRQYPIRCGECGQKGVAPAVIRHTVEKSHDGKAYKLMIPKLKVLQCAKCGEILFDNEADEQIIDTLRTTLGLLTPAEIRGRLDELGLSQKQFADQLRIAPETVSRWLGGALIQSRAMDTLMRLYFQLPGARRFLALARPHLPRPSPRRKSHAARAMPV